MSISKKATITTDNWKGYRPISKDYNITQIPSQSGENFKALHTMIHQIKTWIRTTYSWVSEGILNVILMSSHTGLTVLKIKTQFSIT